MKRVLLTVFTVQRPYALPLLTILPFAAACASPPSPVAPSVVAHAALPGPIAPYAELVAESDPDFPRAASAKAMKPAGQGGMTTAHVIRITRDLPVYRLWNGPEKKDKDGHTNRIGAWWTYVAPRGPVAIYRHDYETCRAWNDFTWVARCTLKTGAIVAIGPGQSVSAEACGDPTGAENYPANPDAYQTYIDKPWARPQELECPPEAEDYRADPDDIAKPAH